MLVFFLLNDDPFLGLIGLIGLIGLVGLIGLIGLVALVRCFVHDVQRVQPRKHGNGGVDCHVFHGRNGRNELVLRAPQEVQQLVGCQVHVVQKHGAQLEAHAAQRVLMLLLALNAPNELLLPQDAALR